MWHGGAGVSDPALDLARHISVLNGSDPSSVAGKISDQKVPTKQISYLSLTACRAHIKALNDAASSCVCYMLLALMHDALCCVIRTVLWAL